MQVRSPTLRRRVYTTLLGAMPDEQRLTVYAKLVTDVLGAIAEGSLTLTAGGSSGSVPGTTELLLTEVLMLLSNPPLRLPTKKGVVTSSMANAISAVNDDDEEVGEGGAVAGEGALQASIAAAKSRLVAKLMKRQVSELVLPTVLGLRQVLQTSHSPVTGALISYVKTLLEDYGEDIKGD